jgi:hypothetical protein
MADCCRCTRAGGMGRSQLGGKGSDWDLLAVQRRRAGSRESRRVGAGLQPRNNRRRPVLPTVRTRHLGAAAGSQAGRGSGRTRMVVVNRVPV